MSNVYGQTLLDDMVQTQGLPMPLVKEAAKEILAVIREGLVRDGVVNVSNFGTFRLKLAAARNGFNPQTKERIVIPAHQRVIFSPCKALRELIQPLHQAPVPIPAEKPEARAAAMSAPIAPGGAVATKRIVPPVPPLTDEASSDSLPPSTRKGERRVTPDRRHSKLAPTTGEPPENPAPAEREVDDISSQLDEIRMELEEKGAKPATPKKGLYYGAAALIVIAAVTAYLLNNDSHDQHPVSQLSPGTTTAAAPHITPPAPTPETAVESPPEAAATEELDYSTLYSEMVQAQPELEPATEPKPIDTPPPAATADSTTVPTLSAPSAVGTEPVAITSHKPSGFFFTERVHTIANGESLWRLAKKHYQDPLLWPLIYQANAALISDPDRLRTGNSITIPSLQGAPGKLTRTDRRNIAEGYYLTYLHYRKTGHKDAFFALLEAKRYDNKVVEEHRSLLQLSKVEEVLLGQQKTMPF